MTNHIFKTIILSTNLVDEDKKMITIDQKIAEYLNDFKIDGWPIGNLILCGIAMLLSVFLCGAIGIERERRGSSAGLRTHLLVGVGSCMIMIISIYGFPEMFEGKRDVARLVAQVVTGIGFLGAGVIMHRNGGGVMGLTTAASIWVVMAVGIACGSFNFILAIVGTFLIIIFLTTFKKIEEKLTKHGHNIMMQVPADKSILGIILKLAKEYNYSVCDISTELVEEGTKKVINITFYVILDKSNDMINEFVAALQKETEAISIKTL